MLVNRHRAGISDKMPGPKEREILKPYEIRCATDAENGGENQRHHLGFIRPGTARPSDHPAQLALQPFYSNPLSNNTVEPQEVSPPSEIVQPFNVIRSFLACAAAGEQKAELPPLNVTPGRTS